MHFGSLLAAMASYCEARRKNLPWLLRIDDIDGPRSTPGSSERIQNSLKRYGLNWDKQVYWQSKHQARYRDSLRQLVQQGLVYRCNCSRKSLRTYELYPGHCRNNVLLESSSPIGDYALRLRMPEGVQFTDAIQGAQSVNFETHIGDIVIWRRDGLVSYSLACAVDDATDCSEVVRGADLLPSTAAQIAIMKYLDLPAPTYAHIPVAVDNNDDKLSKHSKAATLDTMDPLSTLQRAWQFLGQQAFAATTIEAFWSQAPQGWQMNGVPLKLRMAQWSDE